MIFDPKIFYNSYLVDYHKFKSILLKSVLENLPKYEIELFGNELEKENSEAFKCTIKSDLRQTYFHSMESFFEIFFALNPQGKQNLDDVNILYNLSNSNWKLNYDKIVKIASGEMSLDFLSDKVDFYGHSITIGHYLFYYNLVDKTKLPSDFFQKVSESVEAIQYGIKIIAKDFSDREEYNSYKHGLRIIPALSELKLADPKTMEAKLSWDLKDSMSFYCKTKDANELKIKTKLFDSVRDYHLTNFCSNMMWNMVSTRKVLFYNKEYVKKGNPISVGFFNKNKIEECNKINVPIQDLVYTITREYRGSDS